MLQEESRFFVSVWVILENLVKKLHKPLRGCAWIIGVWQHSSPPAVPFSWHKVPLVVQKQQITILHADYMVFRTVKFSAWIEDTILYQVSIAE